MLARLHSYQEKAIDFVLYKKKCALWLDMGLGKTLISLTAIQRLKDQFVIDKVLVIAPLRVANNVWQQEVLKWDHTNHLKCALLTGGKANRTKALEEKADLYIINRENIPWLFKMGYKDMFDMIILDESSGFKNSQSKRFKALKKFSYEYIVELTGTPSPRSLLDVWSQMYLIDKGNSLGKNMTTYKNTMFISDFMGYNFTPKDPAVIYKAIESYVMSMKSKDYLDLPECIFVSSEVDIDNYPEYQRLEKEFVLQYEDETYIAQNAAVLVGKLLQFANGAMYNDDGEYTELHNNKIDVLKELVDSSPEQNILVAYNFKSDLIRLRKAFKDAVLLDGSNDVVERWNKGEIKMMLCHPASSSMGLNLQEGGNNIIWFGLTWNLESYLQFNARLHRQGQTKPVIINHIVANNTVDIAVLSALQAKKSTQDELFNSALAQVLNDYRCTP